MFSVQQPSFYCHEHVNLPKIVAANLLGTVPKRTGHKPFKMRHSLTMRKQESADVMEKFPSKLPVIVEKAAGEKVLPDLDRTKFIVPDDLSMTQFITIVRSRLSLRPTQAFYLMVRNRCLTSMSRTMAEVYWEHKDVDGFLYMTYTAQEMYG